MKDLEIQIINPGDKLVIRIPKVSRTSLKRVTKVAVDFMNRDDFKALVLTTECDLYVIKKGAKVEIEKEKT